MKDITKEWIEKADHDIGNAKLLLTTKGYENYNDIVCFHSQQAAEKYLKAFLAENNIEFKNTHNIKVLIDLCAVKDESFLKEIIHSSELTTYVVKGRYPDDRFEFTRKEAEKEYNIANEVKEFIYGKIVEREPQKEIEKSKKKGRGLELGR